jgi:effector-binding domain-containing protein
MSYKVTVKSKGLEVCENQIESRRYLDGAFILMEEIMSRKLNCFTNGYDTVVAYSMEDAQEVCKEQCNCVECKEQCNCVEDDIEWQEIPDDEVLKIDVNGSYNPEDLVSKTAKEWAEENGRGYLCCTEY